MGVWVFEGGLTVKKIFSIFAIAGLMSVSFSAVAQTGNETNAAEVLKRQILSTIQSVPGNMDANGFEAQIALTIEQAHEDCPVIQRAIAGSRGQSGIESADRALGTLALVYARCARERGTAALGGGSGIPSLTFAPGFSVGAGSSNYSQ